MDCFKTPFSPLIDLITRKLKKMMQSKGEGNANDSGISTDADELDMGQIQGRPSIDLAELSEINISDNSMHLTTPFVKKKVVSSLVTLREEIEYSRCGPTITQSNQEPSPSKSSASVRLYHGIEKFTTRLKRSIRHTNSSPYLDQEHDTTFLECSEKSTEEPEEKSRKLEPENSEGKALLRQQSTGPLEKGEFAQESSRERLPSVLKVDYVLPTLPEVTSQAFRFISRETLWAEYVRLGANFREEYILVDCRYHYEYAGGHLRNAVNLFDPSLLQSFFFPNVPTILESTKRKLPIFYCEFSEVRGPKMANELRKIDRGKNAHLYPHVDFPQIYVLASGYKGIWQDGADNEMKNFCTPKGYVAMYDKKHSEELRHLRQHKSRRNKPRPSALSSGKDLCRKPAHTHAMTPKKRFSFDFDELTKTPNQVAPKRIIFPNLEDSSDGSEQNS